MELLGNAKPGTMAPKTFSKLFDETLTERKFIEQEATSATHALEGCPYLKHSKIVSIS